MKKLLLIMPFIIIIAAIIIMIIPRRSPIERTFDRAIDAANSHDYARFCRYVDIRRVIISYLNLADRPGSNSHLPGNQAGYDDEIERRVQYYIETERIPDPDRFRRLISSSISDDRARALIAFELKRYSVVCTTSVSLRLTSESIWQIKSIDLRRIYSKVKNAANVRNNPANRYPIPAGDLTPEDLIRDILYDGYY
jgi:hypothetical protein